MAVPGRAVATEVTGQGVAVTDAPGVGHETQPEADAEQRRPVGEERQIEARPVPGDQDSSRQLCQAVVEAREQIRLRTLDDFAPVVAGERDRDDRGQRRIEAAGGGIGLDVEAVYVMVQSRFDGADVSSGF